MPDTKVTVLRPRRPCPICGQPSTQAAHPFCSPRCADVDLGRWLNGSYAIPVTEDEDEAGFDEPGTDAGTGVSDGDH